MKNYILTIQPTPSLPFLNGATFLKAAQPLHYLIMSQSVIRHMLCLHQFLHGVMQTVGLQLYKQHG